MAIPSGEVTNFVNILKAYNPPDINYVSWVQTNLVNYSDIPTVLMYSMPDVITENVPLLTALMSVFTDSGLTGAGIYNGKSEAYTNPVMLINSNDEGGGIAITSNQTGLTILGNSAITGTITLSSSVTLGGIYVGSTVNINAINASASGASIGTLNIRYLQGLGGYVGGAIAGSTIDLVLVDEGAYYGGIVNDSPTGTCSAEITNLTTTPPQYYQAITHNCIPLYWTGTTGTYIKLIIQYKKSSSTAWITADDTCGNYVNYSLFVFTNLDHDTYYDFQVIAVCTNGGYGTPVQALGVQTNQTLPTPIG